MIVKGADIQKLILQRMPMLMLDEFEQKEENSAVTALTVRMDNLFLLADGSLAETGLIEHFAQSCSALAGYQSQQRGDERAPLGMIAEVKHCRSKRRVLASEKIQTQVAFTFSFGSMTIAQGTCCVGNEMIAEIELKIFIQ
jgi:3-hydroxymyristoyl/3-hydroxydecanoyl-(acyl carrier protein) dehydratase